VLGIVARVSLKQHSPLCRIFGARLEPIIFHYQLRDWQANESKNSSIVQELIDRVVAIECDKSLQLECDQFEQQRAGGPILSVSLELADAGNYRHSVDVSLRINPNGNWTVDQVGIASSSLDPPAGNHPE
jgi:hypothetical protein